MIDNPQMKLEGEYAWTVELDHYGVATISPMPETFIPDKQMYAITRSGMWFYTLDRTWAPISQPPVYVEIASATLRMFLAAKVGWDNHRDELTKRVDDAKAFLGEALLYLEITQGGARQVEADTPELDSLVADIREFLDKGDK